MPDIKYDIKYDHIEAERDFAFRSVVESANSHRLELSDEDFMDFLKIKKADRDVNWLMRQMGTYKKTMKQALVSLVSWR